MVQVAKKKLKQVLNPCDCDDASILPVSLIQIRLKKEKQWRVVHLTTDDPCM